MQLFSKNFVCSVLKLKCNATAMEDDLSSGANGTATLAPVTAISSTVSQYIYTVLTPLVLLLGCIGNCLCIRVFTRRRFKNQSASAYFAFLSGADLLVLLLYVVPDWLQRQDLLPAWSRDWLQTQIACQMLLFFSYSFRMVSVWMLVTSTVERYIGVRHPMLRRRFCNLRCAKRVIFAIVAISYVLCLWRPFMQVSITVNQAHRCLPRSGASKELFILDAIFAAMLTVIPSSLLFAFNALIARHLLVVRRTNSSTTHDFVGHQFAFLLVMVSTTFLVLTWPYYLCWLANFFTKFNIRSELFASQNFDGTEDGLYQFRIGSAIYVTKTFYYLSYSINFFLYTYASKYFRSEMKRVFSARRRRENSQGFYQHQSMLHGRRRLQQQLGSAEGGDKSSAGNNISSSHRCHGAAGSALLERYELNSRSVSIRRMPTMRRPRRDEGATDSQSAEQLPMMEL